MVVGLSLLAAFFAWQSAEPLWLALGHGVPGTAEVTVCDAADPTEEALTSRTEEPTVPYPCVVFTARHGEFRAVDITLRGAGEAAHTPGSRIPARMISPDRDRAYAADPVGLHLRWSLGMLLVLAGRRGDRVGQRRHPVVGAVRSVAGDRVELRRPARHHGRIPDRCAVTGRLGYSDSVS